ncbi:GNAT family N-acetyltransferase [Roseovarius sp. 2305UL8-3]|uniref:GNAT family N-acetyltransferase n=1 Tax=Roseovarius conchicola TaxID=3121636 RepID=UPI003526C6FF
MTDVSIRIATAQDVDWIAQIHGTLYRRDEGFDDGFQPLVQSVLEGFIADHDPVCERGWVVMQGDRRAGSLFCTRLSKETAKLRLFLLMPELRGRGLGQTLLSNAMGFARDAGYQAMQVSTYSRHAAACALYQRVGFVLTDSKPARAFGHDMIEQSWQIALSEGAPDPK